MKVNTITRIVKVTVDNATLLNLFVDAIHGDARASEKGSKQEAYYRALGHLVGVSDTEAVKRGNYRIMDEENHITVEEFREWLPSVFSEFARAMMEATE